MGSTVFRIPSDVIKPSGYRPRVLYTSSGILNTVDPLASASNLYIDITHPHKSFLEFLAAELTMVMAGPISLLKMGCYITPLGHYTILVITNSL